MRKRNKMIKELLEELEFYFIMPDGHIDGTYEDSTKEFVDDEIKIDGTEKYIFGLWFGAKDKYYENIRDRYLRFMQNRHEFSSKKEKK